MAKDPTQRTLPTAEEAEAIFQESLRRRARELENLRARAGMSMDELAIAMGYKGQSSIQRYLSPDYEKGFRPEIIGKFGKALLGKGFPPITHDDLKVLWNWRTRLPGDLTYDLAEMANSFNDKASGLNVAAVGRRIQVTLPLPEGEASFDMPDELSPKSLELLKAWATLVIDLAEISTAAVERIKAPKPDPSK